jgi:hypothetical protein
VARKNVNWTLFEAHLNGLAGDSWSGTLAEIAAICEVPTLPESCFKYFANYWRNTEGTPWNRAGWHLPAGGARAADLPLVFRRGQAPPITGLRTATHGDPSPGEARLEWSWVPLGEVNIDLLVKLDFPDPGEHTTGLYRFSWTEGEQPWAYVGEAQSLRARFLNYRAGGKAQRARSAFTPEVELPKLGPDNTNTRVAARLTAVVQGGQKVTVSISTGHSWQGAAADMTRREVRLAFECAAVVRETDAGVRMLNAVVSDADDPGAA